MNCRVTIIAVINGNGQPLIGVYVFKYYTIIGEITNNNCLLYKQRNNTYTLRKLRLYTIVRSNGFIGYGFDYSKMEGICDVVSCLVGR